MTTPARTEKKSISLPKSILEKAIERAGKQHRSLSNYLQALIAKDVEILEEKSH